MKQVIHKYQIPLSPKFILNLADDAVILHIAVQNDIPFMWVQVNPESDTSDYEFALQMTGKPFDPEEEDSETHLGTFLLNEGQFVGHLYW